VFQHVVEQAIARVIILISITRESLFFEQILVERRGRREMPPGNPRPCFSPHLLQQRETARRIAARLLLRADEERRVGQVNLRVRAGDESRELSARVLRG
jgi:hypothetical protein